MNRAVVTVLCLVFVLFSGCSAVRMKDTQFRDAPANSRALITFVRESIWLGDGIDLYLWDGETFIGALIAGTMVQYEVAPGEHIFMARSENWSYVKANLVAGNNYFVKANMFPGFGTVRSALKGVEAADDRVLEWPIKRKTKEVVDPKAKEKYANAHRADAAKALRAYEAGSVTYDEVGKKHAF